jgi:hypothetical protein
MLAADHQDGESVLLFVFAMWSRARRLRPRHRHGATLTDKNGAFRLEIPQIIPIFGQPHGRLAYDSGEFKTVFLRPVMRSAKETSLEAHFVLQPA